MADYRPINLCNVLYKLISKVIANWIREVLPILISNSQSAFISEGQITNNILVAYKILHSLRMKKKEKKWFYVIQTRYE